MGKKLQDYLNDYKLKKNIILLKTKNELFNGYNIDIENFIKSLKKLDILYLKHKIK